MVRDLIASALAKSLIQTTINHAQYLDTDGGDSAVVIEAIAVGKCTSSDVPAVSAWAVRTEVGG